MSKRRQKETKRDLVDTSMDTFKEYDNIDFERLNKWYDDLQKRIHEPFDPSELNIEEETEIEFTVPLKSKLFHIEIRGDEDEDYIDILREKVEELARRLINNPDTFISLIRRKPSLIWTDGVIQYTIRKLQDIINPEYLDATISNKTGETAHTLRKKRPWVALLCCYIAL